MPLQKQFMELPLNGGLDTKQSTELQGPASLTQALNLRFNQLGQLEKRPRDAEAASTTPATTVLQAIVDGPTGPMCITRDDGVMERSGSDLSAVGDANTPNQCPRVARVGRFQATSSQETQKSAGVYGSTCATLGDYTVVAWNEFSTTSTVARVRVFETASKRVVRTDDFSMTTVRVVAVPTADAFIVLGMRSDFPTYELGAVRLDASTLTYGTLTTIATSALMLAAKNSVASPGANGAFFVGYNNMAAGSVVRVRKFDASTFAVISTHDGVYVPAFMSLASDAGTDCMITSVVGVGARNVRVEKYGTPGAVVVYSEPASVGGVGFDLFGVGSAIDTANNRHFFAVDVEATAPGTIPTSANGAFQTHFTEVGQCNATTLALVTSISADHCIPASDGVIVDGWPVFGATLWGWGEFPTSGLFFRAVFNGSLSRLDILARFGHDRIALRDLGGQLISDISLSDSKIRVAFDGDPAKENVTAATTSNAQSVMVSEIELDTGSNPLPVHSAADQGVTMVSSGYLFELDGLNAAEAQPLAPPLLHVNYGSAGSTNVATGASMIAISTRVDMRGRLHRSAPSNAVDIPVLAAVQLDARVTVPPVSAFSLFSSNAMVQPYGIELYVTEDGGSTYYLAINSSGQKHVPASSSFRPYALFQDVQLGASGSPTLYSTGDAREEIVSEPPPSFASFIQCGDRCWGLDAEDLGRVWPSKPIVAGFAVEWSTANTMRIADEGVGISDVNGIPAVFAKHGIWVVDSDGPNALGTGGFSPPRRLPAEVECLSASSICKTPAGVVFRTRRGISLLDLGMTVQPIGLPVDKLMPYVEGSSIKCVYDDRNNEVRVIDSANGIFVYNLVEQKWTSWSNDDDAKMWDACTSDGRVWWIRRDVTNGTWSMARESGVDEANRNLSAMPWSLKTPWLKLDGVSGFGRLWRVLHSLRLPDDIESTNMVLDMRVYVDFDESDVAYQATWQGPELAQGLSGVTRWFGGWTRKQRVTAFKVAISAYPSASFPTDPFGGESPVAIKLEVGVQPGGRRQVNQNARKAG